jgi:hypothetical protein
VLYRVLGIVWGVTAELRVPDEEEGSALSSICARGRSHRIDTGQASIPMASNGSHVA